MIIINDTKKMRKNCRILAKSLACRPPQVRKKTCDNREKVGIFSNVKNFCIKIHIKSVKR